MATSTTRPAPMLEMSNDIWAQNSANKVDSGQFLALARRLSKIIIRDALCSVCRYSSEDKHLSCCDFGLNTTTNLFCDESGKIKDSMRSEVSNNNNKNNNNNGDSSNNNNKQIRNLDNISDSCATLRFGLDLKQADEILSSLLMTNFVESAGSSSSSNYDATKSKLAFVLKQQDNDTNAQLESFLLASQESETQAAIMKSMIMMMLKRRQQQNQSLASLKDCKSGFLEARGDFLLALLSLVLLECCEFSSEDLATSSGQLAGRSSTCGVTSPTKDDQNTNSNGPTAAPATSPPSPSVMGNLFECYDKLLADLKSERFKIEQLLERLKMLLECPASNEPESEPESSKLGDKEQVIGIASEIEAISTGQNLLLASKVASAKAKASATDIVVVAAPGTLSRLLKTSNSPLSSTMQRMKRMDTLKRRRKANSGNATNVTCAGPPPSESGPSQELLQVAAPSDLASKEKFHTPAIAEESSKELALQLEFATPTSKQRQSIAHLKDCEAQLINATTTNRPTSTTTANWNKRLSVLSNKIFAPFSSPTNLAPKSDINNNNSDSTNQYRTTTNSDNDHQIDDSYSRLNWDADEEEGGNEEGCGKRVKQGKCMIKDKQSKVKQSQTNMDKNNKSQRNKSSPTVASACSCFRASPSIQSFHSSRSNLKTINNKTR